jgi:hypothetical protein
MRHTPQSAHQGPTVLCYIMVMQGRPTVSFHVAQPPATETSDVPRNFTLCHMSCAGRLPCGRSIACILIGKACWRNRYSNLQQPYNRAVSMQTGRYRMAT